MVPATPSRGITFEKAIDIKVAELRKRALAEHRKQMNPPKEIAAPKPTYRGHEYDPNISKNNISKAVNYICAAVFASFLAAFVALRRRHDERKSELRKLFHTLPEDPQMRDAKARFVRYLPDGDGCVLSEDMVMSGTMEKVERFAARPEDVVVASFPKSGTTWLQEIVYHLLRPDGGGAAAAVAANADVGRTDAKTVSEAVAAAAAAAAAEQVMENRFPYLEHVWPGIDAIDAMPPGRRLIKTHLPINLLPKSTIASGSKILYIYRNPKDVAVSYWHFARMLTYVNYRGSFEKFAKLLTTDRVPYAPYFQHIHGYLSSAAAAEDSNIFIVAYEDLTSSPLDSIRNIAKFLGVEASPERLESIARITHFEAMRKNPSTNYGHWDDLGLRNEKEAQFMRKGQVGDYKMFFHPEFEVEFDEWIRQGVGKTDLKFQYTAENTNDNKMEQ